MKKKIFRGFLVTLLAVPPLALSDPEVKGRIMLDNSFYDGVHNDHERASEWEVRRARVGIEREEEEWVAQLEIDFDGEGGAEIKDAYVTYFGWSFANITAGRMKEPLGLENRTSSLDISTMERSIMTEAFTPGRNLGVEVSRERSTHNWSLGVYESSEDENGLDGYAVTGRAAFSPINRTGAVLHLGVSGTTRDMQGETYEINEPMEVNPAAKVIETPEIVADRTETLALEGAFVYRQFSLQSEWMEQKVAPSSSSDLGNDNFQFDGYYVLASFFLTGESRDYDEGSFDSPSPIRPIGAWEVVARYSSIDLTDVAQGTSANSVLLGVNWLATERARVMVNWARADVEGSSSDESGKGDSLSLRLQYKF